MKRNLLALVVGFTLILWPLAAAAGETRVYVSFSIGGAVIGGGGLLFWSLTYSSRVSQNESDPNATSSLNGSLTDPPEQGGTTAM